MKEDYQKRNGRRKKKTGTTRQKEEEERKSDIADFRKDAEDRNKTTEEMKMKLKLAPKKSR